MTRIADRLIERELREGNFPSVTGSTLTHAYEKLANNLDNMGLKFHSLSQEGDSEYMALSQEFPDLASQIMGSTEESNFEEAYGQFIDAVESLKSALSTYRWKISQATRGSNKLPDPSRK